MARNTIPLYKDRAVPSGRAPTVETIAGQKAKLHDVRRPISTIADSAADVANYIAKDFMAAEEADQYNRAVVSLKEGAAKIYEEAQDKWVEDYPVEYETKFNKRWTDLEDQVNSSITSDNTRKAIAQNVISTKLQAEAKVKGLARTRMHSRYISNAIEGQDKLLDMAIQEDNPDKINDYIGEALAMNEGLYLNGAITEQKKTELNLKLDTRFKLESLKGQIDRDPATAYTLFNSAKPGETFSSLTKEKQADVKEYARVMRAKVYQESKTLEKAIEDRYFRETEKNDLTLQEIYDNQKKPEKDKTDLEKLYGKAQTEVLTPEKLNTMYSKRDISDETYNDILSDMLNPQTEYNNPIVLERLNTMISTFTPGVRDEIKIAFKNKVITRTTYVSLMKSVDNKEISRGAQLIKETFNPIFEQSPSKKDDVRQARYDILQKYYNGVHSLEKNKTPLQYAQGITKDKYDNLRGIWKESAPSMSDYQKDVINNKVKTGKISEEEGRKQKEKIDADNENTYKKALKMNLEEYLKSDKGPAATARYIERRKEIKDKDKPVEVTP